MSEFNNEVYKSLVSDLINDAFYSKDGSLRGKVATIRQYSEVIIRRILNISDQEKVTLGDRNILRRLKEVSNNNSLLLTSLEIIRNEGNDCTHTQKTKSITQNDLERCINSLFNLYSYIFVQYFEKYGFGINDDISNQFSLLPPIIRYITLNYLYEKDNTNIYVIDRLSLAILKAYDYEKSLNWIEERKEILQTLSVVPRDVLDKRKKQITEEYGENLAEEWIKTTLLNAPENMYVLCIDRLKDVNKIIEENGKLYSDFEGAKDVYNHIGWLDEKTIEIKEFNSLMDFVYLGREYIKNNNLNSLDKYITYN